MNVCIVAQIQFGSELSDDPGSATYGLAQYFARLGDNVTLLWVPSPRGRSPHAEEIKQLREWCFRSFLVRLEILTESPELHPGLDRNDKASVAVLHYLKNNSFDAVYFSLEGGLAHFAVTAKQTGVFPAGTPLVVLAHETLLWTLAANHRPIEHKDQITIAHMEKTSVEQCDHLVCASQSVLDWMVEAGWQVPDNTHVIAPLQPYERQSQPSAQEKRERYFNRPINEIVHVGGTEFRNGLHLFCGALDVLAHRDPGDITVTFIGRFGSYLGEHSGGMILRRSRAWPFRVQMLPMRDEVDRFNYIRSRNCLVALTNTAAHLPLSAVSCLDEGIPLIATNVGGIAELIDSLDAVSALCSTSAQDIADCLEKSLSRRSPVQIAANMTREIRERKWEDLHLRFAGSMRSHKEADRPGKAPLVSVITAHYNRPDLLRQAVASVQEQDYPNIEMIVVDDGSTVPEAQALLDELEPEFKRRAWRIIRQENAYLGAARNAGIRAANGERILFLDDDNVLFPNAVSTLVKAMDHCDADICTTFAKWLYEPVAPSDTESGYVFYFPTGGPSDMALIHNPYGDANALFKREVFETIGFLNEQRGFSASDWEFFLRADLAGLKLVAVPEALYWYRVDPEGMNRNADWYENRLPILDVFKRHGCRGLELFHQLGVFANSESHELDINIWNLEHRVTDRRFFRLADIEPNSEEAITLLAEIAALGGRPDTALNLLAQTRQSDFQESVKRTLGVRPEGQELPTESLAELFEDTRLETPALKAFVTDGTQSNGEQPLFYVDEPESLCIGASGEDVTIAVLAGGSPAGTVSISARVQLGDELADPAEFLLLLAPVDLDPAAAVSRSYPEAEEGSSGWCGVSRPGEPREISANLALASSEPMNLIVAVRHRENGKRGRTLGRFDDLTVRRALGWQALRRPRVGPPRDRRPARAIGENELKTAKLLTDYRSDLPLLLVDPDQGGLFLRPHENGAVVAVLRWAFPAFARKLVTQVEIAHEEASPFEFAVALTRPDQDLDWRRDPAVQALAFSGWHRVEEKFTLHDVVAELKERVRTELSINLAIRLPRGSSPSPANAFFRKLTIVWDV